MRAPDGTADHAGGGGADTTLRQADAADTADARDVSLVDAGTADSSVAEASIGEVPPVLWKTPPIEEATVYAFSQVGTDERDPQVLELVPDVVIRAWQWWDTYGHKASDYDFSYVTDAHARGITFAGGGTASVVFKDEFPDTAEFDAIVSRDASGAIPPRTQPPVLYRASLANPAYRQYLVDAAKLQIDGGVDGLFFDEVNGSYSGVNWDGNEGFDDLQIGDFNAFLLDRYPESTDFEALFGMTPDNLLRTDVPVNDITQNFNYRKYLLAKGWASAPMSSANPLAALWGGTIGNLPDPDSTSFVDTVVTNKYWKEIVDALRAYARDKYGSTVFLTSNGIWPHVDFQSVGLYDYNSHGAGSSFVDYVPVTNGHLDGRKSLAEAFRWLKARSDRFAPGVPVVLFLDWPGEVMDRYDGLPASERRDYWRLYAAEAYASGIFFAFHLKTTTGEPTATEAGTLDLFKSLAAFYRAHRTLYHSVVPVTAAVTGLPASAMIQVTDQASPDRRIVHVVNHEYDQGFIEQRDLPITISSERAPIHVTLASPDLAADQDVSFEFVGGQVTLTLPGLVAYDTLILSY